MPLLYYGKLPYAKGRRLYSSHFKLIESSVFDSFKVNSLAPLSARPYIANFWWIKKHSAFSWHSIEGNNHEHTVFIPYTLDWRDALAISREHFKEIIPSSIVFRLTNYEGAYLYD